MQVTIFGTGTNATALVPVFTAIGLIGAAAVAAWVAVDNQRKSVLVQTVTAERAKWRSELRVEMANLSAAVLHQLRHDEGKKEAFQKARVGIFLRINPAGRLEKQPVTGGHNLDRTIDANLRELSKVFGAEPMDLKLKPTREATIRAVEQLEQAVQELLKQEWEVSKVEAITGRLKSPDPK